jgi:hypothetical protein
MSEAGETEIPSSNDPPSPKASRDTADDADGDIHSSKRSRGSDLSSEDQNSFAEACGKVAHFFSGSTFPSIPRGSIDGIVESAVSAACAHLVTTKHIEFPFHRQFTSDDEVKAMVHRYFPPFFIPRIPRFFSLWHEVAWLQPAHHAA